MAGITLTIDAKTAEAAQKIQEFFSGFAQNIQRVTGMGAALEGLGSKLAAAFTVGALVESVREAFNAAEAMGKLSEKTGLALTTLSAFREEAIRLGVPFSELNMQLGMFSDKIYTALRVGGQAAQSFQDLGVRLIDTNGKMRSADEILADVAERFKGMVGGPEKAALAMDIFGRSGRELIPILNQGAEGIERMRATGGPFDASTVQQAAEFNRQVRQLGEEVQLASLQLGKQLLPELKAAVDWLSKVATSAAGVGPSLTMMGAAFATEFTKGLVDGIVSAGTTFMEVFIRAAGAVAQSFDDFLVDAINKVISWLDKSPKLTRLLGGSIQLVGKSDIQGQVDEEIAALKFAGQILKESLDKPLQETLDGMKLLTHLGDAMSTALGGGKPGIGATPRGTGTNQDAPISEEVRKFLEETKKAQAEATQSKLAALDAEETAQLNKLDKMLMSEENYEKAWFNITATYAAKRKELRSKEEEEGLQIDVDQLRHQRELVERDPDKTEMQKRPALIKSYQDELEYLQKIVAIEERLSEDQSISAEGRLAAQKQLEQARASQEATQQQLKSTEAKGTFGGEFGTMLVGLGNQWGTWAGQMASTFKTVFNSAIQSISQGITGLIMGTVSWGQALAQIGTSILTSIVQGIVEMGVRWVMTQLLMVAMGHALMAASVAATAPMAAAASAIWATPATLATIATGGAAAAAAPGEILAANLATMGASVVTFAAGGFTGPGGMGEVAGLVHKGEFVLSAPAVRNAGVNQLQAMHQGLLAGAGGGGGGGGGASQGQQHHHVWLDRKALMQFIVGHPEYEHHVVDLVRRNKVSFGLSS